MNSSQGRKAGSISVPPPQVNKTVNLNEILMWTFFYSNHSTSYHIVLSPVHSGVLFTIFSCSCLLGVDPGKPPTPRTHLVCIKIFLFPRWDGLIFLLFAFVHFSFYIFISFGSFSAIIFSSFIPFNAYLVFPTWGLATLSELRCSAPLWKTCFYFSCPCHLCKSLKLES